MSRLQHKRGRPSNYRKSLQDNIGWEKVKYNVRNRDNHRCVCCGREYGFEVHHITYFVNGKSIVGKELDYLEWLALVCEQCHGMIHSNVLHPLNPRNKEKINVIKYKACNYLTSSGR